MLCVCCNVSVYPVRVGVVLDGMIVISPMYVYMYIFYLFVRYKWCVMLSVVMEHQFHCLCCLSLPTGGVHGHFDCSSQWPSHCSTDTS